jgi:polysaccharide export outer membrane protein
MAAALSAAPLLAQDAPRPVPEAPATPLLEYRIGPADVLQLFVWREPDLTRDITVRVDGKVTVPLLGDVDAAGRTPQELAEEISTRLARFLAAPQVTVGLAQANSARFHVLGQVVKPGDYAITRRTTVLQALALAGGFKEFAKTENIVIIRHGRDKQWAIPVNYKSMESAKDLSGNLVLEPGDTILVP